MGVAHCSGCVNRVLSVVHESCETGGVVWVWHIVVGVSTVCCL